MSEASDISQRLLAGRYGELRYLRALVFYFLMQTLVNFCAAIAFVENRCHYHNVDLRRPHLPGVAGSPWAGRPEMEPNPAGSYVARALCTLGSLVGGITTNVVLELVLVRKARMVEGVDRLRRATGDVDGQKP